MKLVLAALLAATFVTMNAYTQSASNLADIWEKEHISNIFPSDVRHSDLKVYLERLRKLGLNVDEVGRSNANREIYQIEFGRGPKRIFLWSQMHGDEPTATSALIDMLAYFQANRDKDWVKKIEETLTIRVVPMLNPDGAEAYKRRNLQGIDINRDAVNLQTPEARLLKKLRDEWSPEIGFNLHNQQELTTAGQSSKQAAISLLVVFGDAAKTMNAGQERNRRVASAIVNALQQFIPGHIGRYGDEWTPTAFGDNFSAWGTPVILIETGALHGKDEMFLVKMNFVAFVTALQSVVTGSERNEDPSAYLNLPNNSSGNIVHFVFRRANIVNGGSVSVGDIAAIADRRRASLAVMAKIATVGNIGTLQGLDEYDASGFYVYQRFGRTRPGELAELYFFKKDRSINWASGDLEKEFPPDAVFSGGKFIKGSEIVPKR